MPPPRPCFPPTWSSRNKSELPSMESSLRWSACLWATPTHLRSTSPRQMCRWGIALSFWRFWSVHKLALLCVPQALLAAANLLDVMAVREACCRFMERQMDEMNCVGIHCFAEAHSCKVLEKRSMEYILEHFSGVHKQVANWCSLMCFEDQLSKTRI